MTQLLQLQGITKRFRKRGERHPFVAVDDVTLDIGEAECVALVGESGSGKSTLARIVLRLDEPDAGRVILGSADLTALSGERLRKARIGMQPIFQDPSGSFNPRRSVRHSLLQALWAFQGSHAARINRASFLLERVGLTPATNYLSRFPHELSGGQRQRLAVARALAMDPVLIVADEPLSGADVSIRGQILNLLQDLRSETGLAYLMITHDISIAKAFADRVVVMYQGRIVEGGAPAMVFNTPAHEYTRRLVAAVPELREPVAAPAFYRDSTAPLA